MYDITRSELRSLQKVIGTLTLGARFILQSLRTIPPPLRNCYFFWYYPRSLHQKLAECGRAVALVLSQSTISCKPTVMPERAFLLLCLTSQCSLHAVMTRADHLSRFGGDPAPNTKTSGSEDNATVIEQVKLKAAETVQSFMIDMWLARHTPEKVCPCSLSSDALCTGNNCEQSLGHIQKLINIHVKLYWNPSKSF